jgi:hypothetical protein
MVALKTLHHLLVANYKIVLQTGCRTRLV